MAFTCYLPGTVHAAGLVLCTLFLSTFGQEKPVSDFYRTSPPSDGRLNLQVLTNADTNLLAISNSTAEISVAFDLKVSLVGIFYGSSGDVVIINLENQVGSYVSACRDGWVARSKPFLIYFKGLRSLKPLYQCGLKNGEKFRPGNVSDKVNALLQLVITLVSRGEFSVTRSKALQPHIYLSNLLLGALRGPLKGLLNIWGTRVTTIGINQRTLIVRLRALGDIVANSKCGPNVLANFNWNVIFNEPSPIKLFIYIFSKLKAQNVDLRPILRASTQSKVFLAVLGGNSTRGINGVLRVVGSIEGVISGKSSINELVPIVAEYFRNSGDGSSNLHELKRESQEILVFIQKAGLSSELKGLEDFFRGILQNNFKVNGVDLYRIIRICFESRAAPLYSLVRVLTEIRGVVKIETSIGALLYYLTQLTVDYSIGDVNAVVPRLKIGDSVDVRVFIFRGAKVFYLLQSPYQFLYSRPVFNPVLSLIDKSLTDSGCIPLKEIFKSPDFRPFRRALTRLLARVILIVNGKKLNNNTGVLIQNKGHHRRICHETGQLSGRNKLTTEKHSARKHKNHHIQNHGLDKYKQNHGRKHHDHGSRAKHGKQTNY